MARLLEGAPRANSAAWRGKMHLPPSVEVSLTAPKFGLKGIWVMIMWIVRTRGVRRSSPDVRTKRHECESLYGNTSAWLTHRFCFSHVFMTPTKFVFFHAFAMLLTSPLGKCYIMLSTTPSVPNYKSFQKFWKVKPYQSLTKIIAKNIKIYDIK